MLQKAVKPPERIKFFPLYYVLVLDMYFPATEMRVVGEPLFFVLK